MTSQEAQESLKPVLELILHQGWRIALLHVTNDAGEAYSARIALDGHFDFPREITHR